MDLSFLVPYAGAVGTALIVLLFVVLLAACWGMTLMGLPGNWCMIAAGIGYDLLITDGARWELQRPVLVGLLVLAILGEGLEFLAGVFGVRRTGGSKLSAFLALIGSIVGGIAGGIVGLPIPVVGSVIGVLLFASLGALLGAALGEDWHGRDLDSSLRVGMAAFWGRLFGSLAKTLVGGLMVAVALVALVF